MKFAEVVEAARESLGEEIEGAEAFEQEDDLNAAGMLGLLLNLVMWWHRRRAWFSNYGLVVVSANHVAIWEALARRE